MADEVNSLITKCSIKKSSTGSLAGLKCSVKDNIAVKGVPMTCGSKFLKDYAPPYTATIIERLLGEGVEVIGKANLDEFACGGSGETSYFGPTKNPLDLENVPGGSSSGSAASVAAGLCDFSIGSDTGGSIRCPASFTGLVALKPSYGVVSRHGLSDLAMSLESPAPIAKDCDTLAKVMNVISGFDERDARTVKEKINFELKGFDLQGLQVAFLKPDGLDAETSKEFERALKLLEKEGVTLTRIELETAEYSIPAYYLTVYAEFSSAMQKFDGKLYGYSERESIEENRSSLGKEVKRRILLGTLITMKEYHEEWYSKALHARDLIRKEYAKLFKEFDFLLSPVMPFTAYELGSKIRDPLQMYLSDALTVNANLTGAPAGAVPITKSVGLQVTRSRFQDAQVLEFMKSFESVRGELK